jgi:hypothetical protein
VGVRVATVWRSCQRGGPRRARADRGLGHGSCKARRGVTNPVTKPPENAMKAIVWSAALGCTLIVGGVAGCYDEEPIRPAPRTGGSTVVVSDPKPGIASPQPVVQQPAPQSSPPIINNVIQPAPNAPPIPAPAPGNNTTVNVP